MKKEDAKHIAILLGEYRNPAGFNIEQTISKSPITGFHHWADGRDIQGAYLVRGPNDGIAYWILLIEWNDDGGHYLVIFPEDRAGPLAEIHNLVTIAGCPTLVWNYSPKKHDGRNELRKDYFRRYFMSTEANISCPITVEDVQGFLTELFSLVDCRVKADSLDDDNPPATREGFPEGRRIERLHTQRERNTMVVNKAKQMAKANHGRLFCQCCGFDFEETYGEVGVDFIEAHHTIPLSQLADEGAAVKPSDLAMVCSNCHRMLHRKRPWLTMNELQLLLRTPSES